MDDVDVMCVWDEDVYELDVGENETIVMMSRGAKPSILPVDAGTYNIAVTKEMLGAEWPLLLVVACPHEVGALLSLGRKQNDLLVDDFIAQIRRQRVLH